MRRSERHGERDPWNERERERDLSGRVCPAPDNGELLVDVVVMRE